MRIVCPGVLRAAAIAAFGWCVCGSARAQDTGSQASNPFHVHAGAVLSPAAGTITENGIEHPSIVYDPVGQSYTMLFSTSLPSTFFDPTRYGDCGGGVWGLGRATSKDGINWTVDAAPAMIPQPATYYSCAVGDPDVLYNPTTKTWQLYFAPQQGSKACAGSSPPSWGCDLYTGIGYATSTDGVTWSPGPSPVINSTAFDSSNARKLGDPTVVEVDGKYVMLVSKQLDDDLGSERLYQAESVTNGATWTLDASPVLDPGADDWYATRVFGPSLVCETSRSLEPYTMFFGGTGQPSNLTGVGEASSSDSKSWAASVDSPFWQWNLTHDSSTFQQWFAMRAGTDYLLWFTRPNDKGQDEVGLATTNENWDPTAISPRICVSDSTDTDTDTDTDSDSDTDTDSDTGEPPIDSGHVVGHGCFEGPGSLAASWWTLPLAALAFRRRKSSLRTP